MEHIRCLIIGSGPAGYTAAIYASRANLQPVLYEGLQPGGQLTITDSIENFPGFPEALSGAELMDQMRTQVEKFGVEIRPNICVKSDLSLAPYHFWFDNNTEVTADAKTCTISGLESKKKYEVRVCTCREENGREYYGPWSPVKTSGKVK